MPVDEQYLERLRSGDKMTAGDVFDPIMRITKQSDADEIFAAYVDGLVKQGRSKEEAASIVRSNLGYYAGYYNHETRVRVERLFSCRHPMFGKASAGVPTAEEAFEMGQKLAAK